MTKLEVKSIPSSFVARNAKLLQDVGAGEAKLFVGSTAKASEFDAFFGFDTNIIYSFDKDNLLEYLKQVKIEYVYQSINQYKELDLAVWNDVETDISKLSDDDCICHLTRFTDQSRYYVRAEEEIFKKTFRRIALPKITNLVFEKEDNGFIWLRLYVNYEYSRAQDILASTDKIVEINDGEANFTIDELGDVLKEMYNHAKESGQVAAIHMFGFKYGGCIIKNNYPLSSIISKSGINNSYVAELNKGVNIFRSVNANEYGVSFYFDNPISISQDDAFFSSWNMLIDDVEKNGNKLVISLARTQHTLVYENNRFCDTAYAEPAKQYIDYTTVESVYLGTFVKNPKSGSNMVKFNDSIAIISILIDQYGLKNDKEDDVSWHKSIPTEEEYILFKELLAYFVTQLNINNGLVEGERKFANAGSEASKQLIAKWNHFNGFELSCRFARGYQLTQDMASYLNYAWVNINPHYNRDNKVIESIKVNVKPDMVVLYDGSNYSIESLDLFSDNEPNQDLKSLFIEFRNEIYKWQTGYYSNTELLENDIIQYSYSDACQDPGENLVVYGTPGCGKSFYVDHTILGKNDDGEYVGEYKKDNIIRTTFYLDYSNTDFVGQIVPVIEYEDGDRSTVTYKFVPGPFAIALECAFANPTEKVALVIEELNRGNAPCIFGDLFQLLDRIDEEGKEYPIGTSEYGILNTSLINYLKDNEHYNKKYKYSFDLDEIRIPANLSIYATMNTSDQNVFTLDTAFKRRWGFEKLSNKFDDPKKGEHPYKAYFVPGLQHVTWESFVNAINSYIVRDNDLLTSEDKQLGVYFVTKKMLIDPARESDYTEDELKKIKDKFAYKVFEYLWDDVAKYSRDKWFGNIKTLDELIKKYVNEEKVFADDIFQQ